MTKSTIFLISFALLVGVAYLGIQSQKDWKALSTTTAGFSASEQNLFSDWKEFTPPSGSFKVLMPALPQYAKDSVAIPETDKKRRYEIFASEKIDGTLFMVSVITYPPDVDTTNTQNMLKGIVEELMHSKKDNRLKEINQNMHANYESLDFNFESKEFEIRGRVFMVDKTLYVLTYIVRKADFDQAEYKHFIDSFHLLPHSKNEEIKDKN